MTDAGELGAFACRTCGSPLRYCHSGLRCVWGRVAPPWGETLPGTRHGIDCIGVAVVRPGAPRARTVEVFRCSGCRREEKVRPDDEKPDRWCECGGMLVFHRAQTR